MADVHCYESAAQGPVLISLRKLKLKVTFREAMMQQGQ